MSSARIEALFTTMGATGTDELLFAEAATPLLTPSDRSNIDIEIEEQDEKITPEEQLIQSIKHLTKAIETYETNWQHAGAFASNMAPHLKHKLKEQYYLPLRAAVYEFTGALSTHLQSADKYHSDAFLRAYSDLETIRIEKFNIHFPENKFHVGQCLAEAMADLLEKRIDKDRLELVRIAPASSKMIATEKLFTQQIAGMPKLFGDFYRAVRAEQNVEKQKHLALELETKIHHFGVVVNNLKNSTARDQAFAASVRHALIAEYASVQSWIESPQGSPAALKPLLTRIHKNFHETFDSIIECNNLGDAKSGIERHAETFHDTYTKSALDNAKASLGRIKQLLKP